MARTKPASGQILAMPANEHAEQSVIGAMLVERKAIDRAAALLSPSDFYVASHQAWFRIITEMAADDLPVDQVTLVDRVAADPRAARLGGFAGLSPLFDAVPTAANVEHYCKIVREKSLLRGLLMVSLDAASKAQGPVEDVSDLVESVQRRVCDLGRVGAGAAFSPLSGAFLRLNEKITDRMEHPLLTIGMGTGFEEIDDILSGLQNGGYYIIAGRPSMGKSACAVKIGVNAARNGHRVAIYSGEMSEEQIALRIVSDMAEVPSTALMTGRCKQSEYERVTKAMGEMYALPFSILDNPDTTVNGLAASCRQMKADIGLDLLIVDYIGLLQSKKNWSSRREEMGEISRLLKKLALDLDIPILVLSQLSRAVQGREEKRPVMSDLRETGDLEQDADVICFLYREAYYKRGEMHLRNEDGSPAVENAEFIVEKNRLTGRTGTAQIGFVRDYGKFCERPIMTPPTGY